MHLYPTSIDPPPCVLFNVCAVIVSGDWVPHFSMWGGRVGGSGSGGSDHAQDITAHHTYIDIQVKPYQHE